MTPTDGEQDSANEELCNLFQNKDKVRKIMETKVPIVFRKKITIKEKQEMIQKHLSGVKFKELRKEYGYASSTISSILKNKEEIMKIKPTIASTTLSKGRDMIAEMEILLHKWIRETKEEITKGIISKKALEIFKNLKTKNCNCDNDRYQDFKASRGWFERFKRRFNLDDKTSTIETISSDNTKSEGEFEECENFDFKDIDEESDGQRGITPEVVNSLISAWDLVKELVVHHPNLEMAEHACCFFESAIMKYFRTVQDTGMQQTNGNYYNTSLRYESEMYSCLPVKKEIEE